MLCMCCVQVAAVAVNDDAIAASRRAAFEEMTSSLAFLAEQRMRDADERARVRREQKAREQSDI